MTGRQTPAYRDDLYLLNVVLPRWQYDDYELLEVPNTTGVRCRIGWTWEGLRIDLVVDLNVKANSGFTGPTLEHRAMPQWSAPTLCVPLENGALAKGWPLMMKMSDPSIATSDELHRKAPFQLFSRGVVYEPDRTVPTIRLDRPIGFDLGLRNALVQAAGTLRRKGVTW